MKTKNRIQTAIVVALAIIGIISCTKKETEIDTTGDYSCYCWWVKAPGKDTSTNYKFPNTEKAKAEAACATKDKEVKNMSGASAGAYCRLN